MDWMDFDRDGEADAAEEFFGEEMLCSSREEHKALFGDAGDFEDNDYDDDEDDEFVSGSDDTVFSSDDLSGMKISPVIADCCKFRRIM